MRYFLLLLFLPFSIGCSSKKRSSTNSETYHTDTRYKYEHRTGSSGDYNYNYDVSGSDDNGDDVTGNVDMNGKYGNGTISNMDGEDREVDVEWTGYGELEATDEDGNTYTLEVD